MSNNDPYGTPTPPENPYQPQNGAYNAPEGYTAPGTPPAPPSGYNNASAGFNAPPPLSYGAPHQGYASNPNAGVTENDKLLVYLSYFGGLFFSWIIPLVLWVIAPVGTWQKENQRESLNFQITLFIYYVIASLLTVILVGYLLLPALWVWGVIVAIQATLAVNRGEVYRVPGKINFLK